MGHLVRGRVVHIPYCCCRDVSRLQDGLGERLGLLVQWLATLVAGVITSLWVEWRLTLLMALAGILIASSTAALSVVSGWLREGGREGGSE